MPWNPSPTILEIFRRLGHKDVDDKPWEFIPISPDFFERMFRASCCPKRNPKVPLYLGDMSWENRNLTVVLQKFRNGRFSSLTTQQPAVFYAGQCKTCGKYYWTAWDDCMRIWEEEERELPPNRSKKGTK